MSTPGRARRGSGGIPADAFAFYAELEQDNSRGWWTANRDRYAASVRAPLEALVAVVDERYRPLRMFRPHRDVRFSSDKTPYKTHAGAMGEDEGGIMFYVQVSASGMMAASGMYAMAADQRARYVAAVDDDATGSELVDRVAALERAGLGVFSVAELKTAPRGIRRDHPRVRLLRRKGLALGRSWSTAAWMHTGSVVRRVEQVWAAVEPVNEWLRTHVGPSELPPEDAWG